MWLLTGSFSALRPEGRWFEPHYSRQVETSSKSFTRSCLQRFGVLTPTQYQGCIRGRLWLVVDPKRRYRSIRNEWNSVALFLLNIKPATVVTSKRKFIDWSDCLSRPLYTCTLSVWLSRPLLIRLSACALIFIILSSPFHFYEFLLLRSTSDHKHSASIQLLRLLLSFPSWDSPPPPPPPQPTPPSS